MCGLVLRFLHTGSLFGRVKTASLAKRLRVPALRIRSSPYFEPLLPSSMQLVPTSDLGHRRHCIRAHETATAQMVRSRLSDEF